MNPAIDSVDGGAITVTELAARLKRVDVAIVDLRPLAAYNGWRLGGEARGGHIPGAVSLPAAWLHSAENVEFLRLLDAKGITGKREIVLYGYLHADVVDLVTKLNALGERDIRVLDGGWNAWVDGPDLPIERLPNFQQLVHVDWLCNLIAGRSVEAAPADRWLLFHVNLGAHDEYAGGHLPGALFLDTHWLESASDWNRRSATELRDQMRRLGITKHTTVILYGRDSEGPWNECCPARRAGQIAAARAAMILRYVGVDDVRLLDGGYGAWVRARNVVETHAREPASDKLFGATIPARPDLIVDLPEARQLLNDRKHATLVSVRSWSEHVGASSGYDFIELAGRIQGDVWIDSGTDAYHMQNFRNFDNTMRPYTEIAANWAKAGITSDKRVAFYCGTGWRAAETWFYAWLMDWPRIAVYDGGWFEWSADPLHNPIEVGISPRRTLPPRRIIERAAKVSIEVATAGAAGC